MPTLYISSDPGHRLPDPHHRVPGPTINNNYGSGSFNNIHGTQVNSNNGMVIINCWNTPTNLAPSPPPLSNSISLDIRYQDTVINLSKFSDMLRNLTVSELSPLSNLLKEMTKLASIVTFVTQALSIIDRIPSDFRLFTYFRRVRTLTNELNLRLYTIYEDIQDYYTYLSRYQAVGFWHGIILHVYIHYRWGALFTDIQDYLKENRAPFNRFLTLMATHDWQQFVNDDHGQRLGELTSQIGLQPEPGIIHLQTLKIWVTDPLGRRLPIPMEFCSSLVDFEIAVKLFCRNIEGSSYIQRGAWEIVRPSDNYVVKKSDLMEVIEPGIELDISVLVQIMASSLYTCPRCGHDNFGRISYNGWIECDICRKDFRIMYETLTSKSPPTLRSMSILKRAVACARDSISRLRSIILAPRPLRLNTANAKSRPDSTAIKPPASSPERSSTAHGRGRATPAANKTESLSERLSIKFHRVSVQVQQIVPTAMKTLSDETKLLVDISPPTSYHIPPNFQDHLKSAIPLASSKAKALLIGIGDDGAGQLLLGPREDVIQMRKLLIEQYNYQKADIVVMHDHQRLQHLIPTRENILREIDSLVEDSRPGDRFVFHYSGHTGQQDNLDGTEVDGMDERIETKTGPIIDDELRRRLIDPLCPGSQFVAILDSCHSATLLDLPHVECHLRIAPILRPLKRKDSAAKTVFAEIKQGLGAFRGRGRLPSVRKSKKPKLTLDFSSKNPTAAFTASGPATSILPPDTSFVFSPVVGPCSPIRAPSRRGSAVLGVATNKVDFYADACNECFLPPRDRVRRRNSEMPMVLAISACKDSQYSYEDANGNGMTKALCQLLYTIPNPTLNRLYTGISFSLFNPAYDRVHSEGWVEWLHKWKENGAAEMPNCYQHPSLSSLQRLNPNWKLSL